MKTESARLVVVALNGVWTSEPRLWSILNRADYIIAADGGANWLVSHRVTPQLLMGDMDSIDPSVLERLQSGGCRIQRHPAQKDETDAELALAAAAELRPQEIIVLGALGGRIDHALANLALLAMPQLAGIPTRIWDGVSLTWLATGTVEIQGAPGDTVSLIPWGGDVCGIVTQGLAYPLQGETLRVGPSRGVSNALTDACAHVTVGSGSLLIVHTPSHAQERTGGD